MEKPHRYLKCNYEDKCRYAHGQDELRSESSNPKYMPKPCRKYSVSGYCKCLLRCIFCMEKSRGKPNFVVISRKIRNAPTGDKCRFASCQEYHSDAGYCKYGFRCAFLHGEKARAMQQISTFEQIGI